MKQFIIMSLFFLSIETSYAAPKDVCQRSDTVRAYLEKELRKPCYGISDTDLASLPGPIQIESSFTSYLSSADSTYASSDFQGLTAVRKILLRSDNNGLQIDADVFSGLSLDDLTIQFRCGGTFLNNSFNGLKTNSLMIAGYLKCNSGMGIEKGAFNGLSADIIFLDLQDLNRNEVFKTLQQEYPNLYFSKQN